MNLTEEEMSSLSNEELRWLTGHVLGIERGSEGGEWSPCGANFALPSLSLSLAAHLPGVVFGRLAPFPSERLTLLFFRHLPACLPSRKSLCGQQHDLQQ